MNSPNSGGAGSQSSGSGGSGVSVLSLVATSTALFVQGTLDYARPIIKQGVTFIAAPVISCNTEREVTDSCNILLWLLPGSDAYDAAPSSTVAPTRTTARGRVARWPTGSASARQRAPQREPTLPPSARAHKKRVSAHSWRASNPSISAALPAQLVIQ
jgi:hypothetical protein